MYFRASFFFVLAHSSSAYRTSADNTSSTVEQVQILHSTREVHIGKAALLSFGRLDITSVHFIRRQCHVPRTYSIILSAAQCSQAARATSPKYHTTPGQKSYISEALTTGTMWSACQNMPGVGLFVDPSRGTWPTRVHTRSMYCFITLFYKTYIHVSGVSSGGGGVVRSFFADGGDSGRVCLWMLERFRFSKKNSGGR